MSSDRAPDPSSGNAKPNVDLAEGVVMLIEQQRTIQARQWVHEMLLMQTFLRFADATGRRKEFAEMVLDNMASDIDITKASVRDGDPSNKQLAEEMSVVFADLSARVNSMLGSPSAH